MHLKGSTHVAILMKLEPIISLKTFGEGFNNKKLVQF
jgi:hypothetical protein